MELRAPAALALRAGRHQPEGLELRSDVGLEGFAGFKPERGPGSRVLVQGHPLAAPERTVPLDPLYGQGIEHLMGEQHTAHRLINQLLKAEPAAGEGCIRQPSPLTLGHAGIGFDQHQLRARRQLRPLALQGLSKLQGQIALTGAGFHQGQGLRAGQGLQPLSDLRSEQFSEIWAEGGRGGEIAAGPHLQPARAIGAVFWIVEGPLHVGEEGHRATRRAQALLQPGGSGVRGRGGRAHEGAKGSGRMLATEAGAMNRVISRLAGVVIGLVLLLGLGAAPALAYDNPDLLPDHPTPVIDLAKILTDNQRAALEAELNDFEAVSGWKLRVLTQYDRTPGLAVKDFWGLDERSLLLIADERGGNLLNFNVGDALFALMPRTYWVELQTRFGNVYYVRDHGQDASILDSLHTVKGCLEIGGCQVVPGLPQEQWLLTLATSVLGGLIVGFAAYPRKPEHTVEWAWVLLLSPLWVILFGVFGIAPIITRTPDLLPLLRNALGFVGAIVAAYLVAQNTVGKQRLKDSES